MLQFSQFVWALSYSVWDVFNNVFLIDATDRSKISWNQKRLFFALSLFPLSFFATTSLRKKNKETFIVFFCYRQRFKYSTGVNQTCHSCFLKGNRSILLKRLYLFSRDLVFIEIVTKINFIILGSNFNLYINLACLSGCLFVCLFVCIQ